MSSAGNHSIPLVAIVMGSDSDLGVMKGAADALRELGVPYEARVLSAHRAPEETADFARGAKKRGVRAIVAGAGGAAHLPGVIASLTELPVIGVPVCNGALQGVDALYAIVQMPKGIPVATVAIDGAYNAGVLAAQIIAAGGAEPDAALGAKLTEMKEGLRKKVLSKKAEI